MKRLLIVALLAALVTGCDPPTKRAPHDYESAPRTHVCTVEQMNRVHHESTYCDENTGFFSSYCYGTSIMRNCTKKE